jgi:hypothetical protein
LTLKFADYFILCFQLFILLLKFSIGCAKGRWLWQGGLGSPELLVQEARQPSDRRIAVIDRCFSPAPRFDPALAFGEQA